MSEGRANIDYASLAAMVKASTSSVDEEITLVSQCGKRFRVNVELALASSEYFQGIVNNHMIEFGMFSPFHAASHDVGRQEMVFNDVCCTQAVGRWCLATSPPRFCSL